MKRHIGIALLSLILSLACMLSNSRADMQSYCQMPPIIGSAVSPNIFFDADVSGSMSYYAYNHNYDTNTDMPYSAATSYEGYFDPAQYYAPDGNGIFQQTTLTGQTCQTICDTYTCYKTNRRGVCASGQKMNAGGCSGSKPCGSCTKSHQTGDCNVTSGNYLNWQHMSRIDLLRWAVTGGKPSTCVGTQTFNSGQCDPELWNQPGNNVKVGSVCNDSLVISTDGNTVGGCILLSDDGTQVKVPWSRVNAGLAFEFENLSPQPRMGGQFFSDAGVRSQGQVYMGDFTAPNSTSTSFPYLNLITAFNSSDPSGSTPTGPAMWDTLSYFQQDKNNPPQYGGIPVQQGSGDRWKNPLYVCDGGGSNCTLVPCAKNFAMLLSDGQWNTNGSGQTSCSISNVDSHGHSTDPVVPAYQMHQNVTNVGANYTTNIDSVYTIGLFLGGTGDHAMRNIAMYGSYDTGHGTWPDSLTGYPQGTCTMDDCGSGRGSGCTALPAPSSDWDSQGRTDANGNAFPDTAYSGTDALTIKDAIYSAVLDALRRTSSGTAVSILASSKGSGAAMIQAVFYPKRVFDNYTEATWTSEMDALWYYLDPALQNNTIREDTVADKKLIINQDYVVQFRFDSTQNKTVVDRYSDDGKGNYTFINTVNIENISALWKAGTILLARNAISDQRTIYTTTDLQTLTNFTGLNPNLASNQSLLQAASAAEATNIINYIQGVDQAGYRSRTVTLGGVTGVWKLGDIISSTPRIEASVSLNQYDLPPSSGYGDTTYSQFTSSLNYLTRNMVYAAANDGMLHAFRLGTLDQSTASGYQKATLCDDTNGDGKCESNETSTVNLGREQWSYIPYNAMPYLKYLSDPNYCHLFYVDGPLYLFDASINKNSDCAAENYSDCKRETNYQSGSTTLDTANTSWRTVLIGSMGLGGACRNYGVACNGGTTNCVNTPVSGVGYSSYFAFDVTSPGSPSLKWEFSDPSLGYSMAGPAVIRLSAHKSSTDSSPDVTKNGKWFAVFASGPTGPIDTSSNQFMGKSDQNLKLFVIDLVTGAVVRTIVMDGTSGTPKIPNAFATAFFNSPVDTDRWNSSSPGFYQDNAFYIGYVKQCPSSNLSCTDTTWTNGGILRVITNEDMNPNNWTVSLVIDDIGPVTSSVAKLQDRNRGNLWLYFGTGRYFYKSSSAIDDPNGQRALYGIKEPCYSSSKNTIINGCTTQVSSSALTNVTTDNSAANEAPAGWFINLSASSGTLMAERVITDPLSTPSGIVYFTTFMPNSDVCSFGGNTYLWAVGYNTGTSDIDVTPSGVGVPVTKTVSSVMKGTALMQVSTGAIVQENLATTFASGRKSAAITGQPPKGQGLSIVTSPRPLKKILHIKEK